MTKGPRLETRALLPPGGLPGGDYSWLPVARAAGIPSCMREPLAESNTGTTIAVGMSHTPRAGDAAEGARDGVVKVERLATDHGSTAEGAGLAIGQRQQPLSFDLVCPVETRRLHLIRRIALSSALSAARCMSGRDCTIARENHCEPRCPTQASRFPKTG